MHKQTVIVVEEGQSVPDAFWEKAITAETNVYGYAMVSNGEVIWGQHPNPTPTDLNELRAIAGTSRMVFFLGHFPGEFHEDDQQPFVVQANDKDEAQVLAFLAGDFTNWAEEGSSRADAYFACENMVVPQIAQLWEFTGGNIDKLMMALDNKAQENVFKNLSNTKSFVVLVSANDIIKVFAKGAEATSFEWGHVSDTHGYAEQTFPVKEPFVVPAEKAMTVAEKLRSRLKDGVQVVEGAKSRISAPSGAPAVKSVIAPKAEVAPAKVEPPVVLHKPSELKKPLIASTTPITQQTQKISLKGKSNGERKKLINQTLGYLPQGWKDLAEIDVPLNKVPPRILKDLSQLAEVKAQAGDPPFEKDVSPSAEVKAAVEASEGNKDAKTTTATIMLPIIPIAQRHDFDKKFMASADMKTLLAKKDSVIPSPDEIQEMENKLPSFSQQMKQNIEDTFRWPHVSLRVLIRDYPDIAAVLMETYRLGYIKHFKSVGKTTEKTTTTTTIAPVSRIAKAG